MSGFHISIFQGSVRNGHTVTGSASPKRINSFRWSVRFTARMPFVAAFGALAIGRCHTPLISRPSFVLILPMKTSLLPFSLARTLRGRFPY